MAAEAIAEEADEDVVEATVAGIIEPAVAPVAEGVLVVLVAAVVVMAATAEVMVAAEPLMAGATAPATMVDQVAEDKEDKVGGEENNLRCQCPRPLFLAISARLYFLDAKTKPSKTRLADLFILNWTV